MILRRGTLKLDKMPIIIQNNNQRLPLPRLSTLRFIKTMDTQDMQTHKTITSSELVYIIVSSPCSTYLKINR